MQTIPVTLAERPHPFPSRTRKLSSPAPKILRGQPFGKIGRRRDCCVNAASRRVGPRRPTTRGVVTVSSVAMTVTGEPTRTAARRGATPPRDRRRRPATGSTVARGLSLPRRGRRQPGGAPTPPRDHRCGAIAPPAAARRRRSSASCASRRRTSACATYLAARAVAAMAATATPGAPTAPPVAGIRAHRPVVLEPARPRSGALPGVPRARSGGQARA